MTHLKRYDILFVLYIIICRISLNATIGLSFFSIGLLFDIGILLFITSFISSKIKKTKNQKIFYLSIMLFLMILTTGTAFFFNYFQVLLSFTNIHSVKWLRFENGSDYSLSIPNVWIYLTAILIVFAFYMFKQKQRESYNKIYKYGLLGIFVFQLLLISIWSFTSEEQSLDYYESDAHLYKTMYDREVFATKYGFFNYHLIDLIKPNIKHTSRDTEAVDTFYNDLEAHEENPYSNLYEDYNVITITAETLDTRFIDPVLTPTLSMMRDNGYSFDNFYTTVYQNGATCNSEYMALTGLNAVGTDDLSINACDQYTENSYPYSLPNQLKTLGYNTYYFHSGYPWLYDRDILIPSYGFETVKFRQDILDAGYNSHNDRFDTEMNDFLETYVDYDNPFYINLLTYSMHGAYDQEEFFIHNQQVNDAHPEELPDDIRNYMQKLVEFDMMLKNLLETLENEGVLDNTLIIIYPDHYPYMMDHEFYLDYHQIDNTYELKRQDLIIYNQNIIPEIIHTTGSTEDITPSILNLINSELNFDNATGLDLFSKKDNYVLFNDLTVTDGDNYLNINDDYIGNPLYKDNLATQLELEIYILEVSRKIQHTDYFKE